jgi:hypothetical protein
MMPVDLSGWIPARFFFRDGQAAVEWLRLGPARLLDPFFDQTLRREKRKPSSQPLLRETGVDTLLAWAQAAPGLPLRGLIFHTSRCGSTLLSQMLAAPAHHVVASEPAPLDGVLQAPLTLHELDRATHIAWIRAMVSALGQPRAGSEDAFFIKLDCWHIHHAGLLRAAFPATPFVFLYRDPVEVMASHAKIPAAWTVPSLLDPRVLQLTPDDWQPQAQELYRAKALANIYRAGLESAAATDALLVSYDELPDAMFSRIALHFGLLPEDFPPMRDRCSRNAKSPAETFAPDSATKRNTASPGLRTAAETFVQPLYRDLETRRREQIQHPPAP